MPAPDLLRPSRDGDQFHYTWAARQSLRLLDERSGLHALFVEATDPSEQPGAPDGGDPADVTTDVIPRSNSPDGDREDSTDTGDEVIDLAEYWGSSDIDAATRVVYRQFKHSTRRADQAWTMSFLHKTLVGFAKKYATLNAEHPAALDNVEFEFISNRIAAASAKETLADLANGTTSSSAERWRVILGETLNPADIRNLFGRVRVDDRAPSLLRLRHLLDLEVADLLPGAPAEQALLLREMISSRATSIGGDDPAVRREDVLSALKTSEDQLLPAPNRIEPPPRFVERAHFADIASAISDATGPVIVHGPGGVGKSVLAQAIDKHLPAGSVSVVYDCYGNGSYRQLSAPRHRVEQGLVQIVNELAKHALCDPLIPSATAKEPDYARTFLRRLGAASATLQAQAPGALLIIVLDAADNAAMFADELGEQAFVTGLMREPLPPNVRLALTCRPERIIRLKPPPDHVLVPLTGFGKGETRAHLERAFDQVRAPDVAEFHNRTGGNPRVQATVLDATTTLREALGWLAPDPSSPTEALNALIERQMTEIRDLYGGQGSEIDQICVGLASLRPMIPTRVLADLAEVHVGVVTSFVADLGRPLLIDGDTVQFRDEPTETWFRDRYRPAGAALDAFIARLIPWADENAYVAASVPALLFEAGRYDDLVQLALSDDALPDNTKPAAQRNEVQRAEISQQRAHFALSAALRSDRDLDAAQLALRLGALTAGRTRRLDLIRENTDLSARLLEQHVLEQLVATRSLHADWPSSNLPIEGALLAGADGQTDQARNRLRSAITWMRAWTRQASRDGTPHGVELHDILQVAWGLFNVDGAAVCVDYLRAWRPATIAFDVGVDVVRRLLDAGRLDDVNELAKHATGRHLKLAVAQACAERDAQLTREAVSNLVRPLLKRAERIRPSRRDDYHQPGEGDPLHGGLTAVNWLLASSRAHDIVPAETAVAILRRYLPDNLGHHTGDWYDRQVWQIVLGFALLAHLEGRDVQPADVEGPRIREARTKPHDSSGDLRAFQANIEPLLAWASTLVAIQCSREPEIPAELLDDVATLSTPFLQRRSDRWQEHESDQTLVNNVILVIGRLLARQPKAVPHDAVGDYLDAHGGTVFRRTRIQLIRQLASRPELQSLASMLARQAHGSLLNAREDAGERAKDFVSLTRATIQVSREEAAVHFQAAMVITDGIGDDLWTRWNTLLAIANLAASDGVDQPGRAYRLGQIAEGLEPYVGDHVDHTATLQTIARLSIVEALAIGSRWRDRRTAGIEYLCGALTHPDPTGTVDAVAVLALHPLADRTAGLDALAKALATKPSAAARIIGTFLAARRSLPVATLELHATLEKAGIGPEVLAGLDTTLVPSSTGPAPQPTPVEGQRDPGDKPEGGLEPWALSRTREPLDIADIDLTTVAGWAAALTRARERHQLDTLFSLALTSPGPSAPVIAAFCACPSVDAWSLRSLVATLDNTDLTMAAQLALDSGLVSLLPRLASEVLLSPWRPFSNRVLQALTTQDTDYMRVAARALADQPHFTADQAFGLAVNLADRLSPESRRQLLDVAFGLFADAAASDAFDGNHPTGIVGPITTSEALACTVWGALGDPAGATRWRAAHTVHQFLALGADDIVEHLHRLARGEGRLDAFLDSRLPFYDRHALQWLLFAAARASTEPLARATVARLSPLFLHTALTATPHAVITPLARDCLLRLSTAGHVSLTAEEDAQVVAAGKPTRAVQHSWNSPPLSAASLADLITPMPTSDATHPTQPSDDTSTPAPTDAGQTGDDMVELSPCSDDDEEEEEERYNFFFDFRSYWCDPLGDAFALTAATIERLVAEVMIDHWSIDSRGESHEDPRRELGLYPSGSYPHKSDWPQEEDLDFYLSTHALYEVAGHLLRSLPVVLRDEDDSFPEVTEYTRFLARHTLARRDGRWLADRRDAPPPRTTSLRPALPTLLPKEDEPKAWRWQVTRDQLICELQPEHSRLSVWGYRRVDEYDKSETVRVHSALVTPSTAPALLRALQTAPDKHAYRIPDASDDDYSYAVPGFELAGWIRTSEHTSGRDRQDPLAGNVDYPPYRPDTRIGQLQALRADPDLREWRVDGRPVMWAQVWDTYDERTRKVGSTGETLTADREWLATWLAEIDRWLLVEVEIKRDDDTTPRYLLRGDDDGLGFPEPYTLYVLLDPTGETHAL